MGDIDVLGVIPSARAVLAIECKDFALARTPVEIQHQLEQLVEGSGESPSAIEKHLARVQWVEQHLDEVLLHCFGIQRRHRWTVVPILVSDAELFAPYLKNIQIPVVSVESLRAMTVQKLLASHITR